MKQLVTARNILNQDDIDTLINQLKERYDTIVQWLEGPLRRWIIKNAPAEQAQMHASDDLPDWLKRAMNTGDQLWTIDVERTRTQIQPVLDYMENLVEEKPDTKIMQIGFDVAKARAKKWHEQMERDAAKRAAEGVTVDEPGTKVIKQYPDGYTWRSVFSKPALEREGNVMGHCVGRMGYYNQVVRDKCTIVSLRDERNEPHVTIEINNDQISQIKGKANQEVLPKYLSYVEDYLKSGSWSSINFDGARSIHESVIQYFRQHQKPVFEHNGLRLVKILNRSYSSTVRYEVLNSELEHLGAIGMGANGGLYEIDLRVDGSVVDEFLAAYIIHAKCPILGFEARRHVASQSEPWQQQSQWSKFQATKSPDDFWGVPLNDYAKSYAVAVFGVLPDQVLSLDGRLSGYRMGNDICLTGDAIQSTQDQTVALILAANADQIDNVSTVIPWSFPDPKPMRDMTARVQKRLAGSKISDVGNRELMETLVQALKQPALDKLVAAARALEKYDDPRDADFKQHGIPTGGRTLNAVALLLTCSLVKNQQSFRQYVFKKPNALTCFAEVLTQPDHVNNGLKSYGIDDEKIISIVLLLRNEFLRLVPSADELKELDLDVSLKHRVQTISASVHGQKNNKVLSKEIWSH